jgi:hypothetical protein
MKCGGAIESTFKPGGNVIEGRAIRTPHGFGRHHSVRSLRTTVSHSYGVRIEMSNVFGIEFERGCLLTLIVTGDTVLVEDRLNLRGSHRLLQGCCRPRVTARRNDDETQNAGSYNGSPVRSTHDLFRRSLEVLNQRHRGGFRNGGVRRQENTFGPVVCVRPTLSFASRRAPFDTRNSMILSDPRFAAPINAVKAHRVLGVHIHPSS